MRLRFRSLTTILVLFACRGESASAGEPRSDTIAPIGTGTELLLTRERLALIDGWIRASIARTGDAPSSLDEVEPPASEASQYVPLGRYLRDGWGRSIEYEYGRGTRSYELRSRGEDGTPGTGDDIILSGSP